MSFETISHYLPHTGMNLKRIVYRQVYSNDGSEKASSLIGRMICLVHTLATPLKALSGLGKLAMTVLETAKIVLGVLTLNTNPKKLLYETVKVIDVLGGAILLPVALLANVIRGVVGIIFHPGAMILHTGQPAYTVTHNMIYGTVFHYY